MNVARSRIPIADLIISISQLLFRLGVAPASDFRADCREFGVRVFRRGSGGDRTSLQINRQIQTQKPPLTRPVLSPLLLAAPCPAAVQGWPNWFPETFAWSQTQ